MAPRKALRNLRKRRRTRAAARLRREAATRAPVGAPPGTLVAAPEGGAPVLRAIGYGPDTFEEHAIEDPRKIRKLLGKWPVLWINIDGLGDTKVIEAVGELFQVHHLALEDVTHLGQRPKVEFYEGFMFAVCKMISRPRELETEQVSLFLGEGYVLTFQERVGDCLEPVRERIRNRGGRIRSAGADYLAYALLDTIIDAYFPVVETYGETIETLEQSVYEEVDPALPREVHAVRRDLVSLRRILWSEREALSSLARAEGALITPDTSVYVRDCYDHAIQLMDLVENYREACTGLLEGYQTAVGNRMNEVMKVLTIIATIFIPLSFVAGLYGMNFDPSASPLNMPELDWYWGYPFALTLMLMIAVGMLLFFRRKGWLGRIERR